MTSYPKSRVLVLALNSVQSLLPTTLIAQAESLLESHKIDELVYIVNEQRKKLQAKLVVEEDEIEELYYVYQRIGYQFLSETRFEDAGYHLFEGNVDPRILVSYFPSLRGKLFTNEDELDVYSGVAEHMPPYASIEDIIIANIARTYSPHLSPNTRSAPPTAELRRMLMSQAIEMLQTFLRKWKRVRGDGESGTYEVLTVVDTVLAKLYAQNEQTKELYDLISTSPYLVLSELEIVFKTTGQYNALCTLFLNRGEDGKVLELWSKLVDGEWTDPDIPDPLSDMFNLLAERKDRRLTQKWGIWLTKKDSERAIKLLTSQGPPPSSKRAHHTTSKSSVANDLAMLKEIRAANPEAGVQFLEHLVLAKRSADKSLHTELALICVDQVLMHLRDDTVWKLWRAKAASYASASSSNPIPTLPSQSTLSPYPSSSSQNTSATDTFLSYFSKTTPDSPSKKARLKLALFLQASELYDIATVKARLDGGGEEVRDGAEKVLSFERAIVEGKLGNHTPALTLLALDIRDHVSAERYCLTRGTIVTSRLAKQMVEREGLGPAWGYICEAMDSRGGKSSGKGEKDKAGGEEDTTRLLRILLETYVGSDENVKSPSLQLTPDPSRPPLSRTTTNQPFSSPASINASSNLLNSQAGKFDPVDVVDLIPPEWPLKALSAFLSRSFRRTLHARHEGMILKGIAMGENLAVSDEAHAHFHAAGAIIEEALPPSPSSPSYEGWAEKEKEKEKARALPVKDEENGLDEKAALEAEIRTGDEDRDRDGDGDDGFGDFQGGGGGAVLVPRAPSLLDTLKGIDGRGALSMSLESGVTEPQSASEEDGRIGNHGRDGEGDGEDWFNGLR